MSKEITPIAINMSIERRDLYKIIRPEWVEYLNNLDDVQFDAERFVGELWQYVSESLWIEDYEKINEMSKYVFNRIKQSTDDKPASKEQLRGLHDIAEKHIKRVKRNIPQLEKLMKEIVEDLVIPSLESHIADPI